MSSYTPYLFLLLCLWLFSYSIGYIPLIYQPVDYGNHESRLRKVLIGNKKLFDKQKLYSNASIELEIGFSLISIISLDSSTNIFTGLGWARLVWVDETMRWNRDDFGRIDVLRIPYKDVWIPDIVLQNSAEIRPSFLAEHRGNVLAYPDGTVLWVPSTSFETSCAVDLKNFPFDSHLCTFVVRSWSNDRHSSKLIYYGNKNYIDLQDYIGNNEWEVQQPPELYLHKKLKKDVSTLFFAIKLVRRSYYYVVTLIVPIVLSWIIMLVLFSFPIGSEQRIFLSVFAVTYLEILLLQLQWIIPHNGSVPQIVSICGQSILLAAFSVVLSVIMAAILKMDVPPNLPNTVKNVLTGCLGRVFCYNPNSKDYDTPMQLISAKKAGQTNVYKDWILLATVINRFFFSVYFCVFIILTLTLVL